MSLGENIQFMRKMRDGMTQEELAEKLNVSRQTISKWEMDNAFPEMDKVIALSEIFNCTLDELIKENMNTANSAYHNLRVEEVKGFRYVRYAVISAMPEDDAKQHMMDFASGAGIKNPEIIGWDFPFVSQEQTNVYHMHGYCTACILPDDFEKKDMDILTHSDAKYAVITIENPFSAPFVLIPNAYKTLLRYVEVKGFKEPKSDDIIECYEKEYEKDGVTYMDVYIAVI